MKIKFTTSCNSSSAFPNLTTYVSYSHDYSTWKAKTMLLFKSVHFKSLRERMVDKNLKVPTPLGTLAYYNTPNTVYILLQQNVLVLYLSTFKCTVLGPMFAFLASLIPT